MNQRSKKQSKAVSGLKKLRVKNAKLLNGLSNLTKI
jgi:hypothetical protein